MIPDHASGTIGAVLSVADPGPAGDYPVTLTVRCPDIPGLADPATVTAVLDRASAEALGDDAASLGRCLDLATPPRDRIAAGQELFGAVFRGEVADLWARLQLRAAEDHPLRIRLDVRPAGLRVLPWELLHGPNDWMFLQNNTSVWRGTEPDPPAGSEDRGPLRVLVVVCNPRDQRLLGDRELAGIAGALAAQLSKSHVAILDGPAKSELSGEIDRLRPHVLHFIGHGMPRVAGQGAELAFNWDPREPGAEYVPGSRWELGGEAVRRLADWVPPLVVINACRTAADPRDPIGGLADAFLAAGARATVSMQADIQSRAAVHFSAVLYQGLAELSPLDQVVARARRQMDRDFGGTGEWALPVLSARTDPADVLRISFAPTTSSISGVCQRREYGQLRGFLDRFAERWNAWWALDPQAGLLPSPGTGLVIGGRPVKRDDKPGKTWLTRWCLLTCFLRGYRVTYADLKQPLRYTEPDTGEERQVKTKDWLDAIRVIRDACLSAQQLEPLPAAAFDEFNSSLNVLVGGSAPAARAAAAPGPVRDEWRSFNDDRRRAVEQAQQICAEFLAALRAMPGERPHVIALDNVDSILPEAFESTVYPWLLRPVAEDRGAEVRLVLVASDEWLAAHLPAADRDLWTWLHLQGFEPGQFMRLAWDYCQRHGLELDENLLAYFNLLARAHLQSTALPVNFFEEAVDLVQPNTLVRRP